MRKLTDDEAPYYGQPVISFYVDTVKLKGTKDDPERYKYNRVHRVRDGQFVMVSDEETSSAIMNHVIYEMDFDEFVSCLDRAIAQGEVEPKARKFILKAAKAPVTKEETRPEECVIFRNERYLLGYEKGRPVIYIDGRRYEISGHYYEPVTWFSDGEGHGATIHDFDSSCMAELRTNPTFTFAARYHRECDPLDFCGMLEYALTAAPKVKYFSSYEADAYFGERPREKASVIHQDPFYAVAAQYDRGVFDYRIVEENYPYKGVESHRLILFEAVNDILRPGKRVCDRSYDWNSITPRLVNASDLFSPNVPYGQMNFRSAFLEIPEKNGLSEDDFFRLCAAMFPNGPNHLEVYAWPTDWLEYFYDADEPWKACCYTILDRSRRRYIVIMASTPETGA